MMSELFQNGDTYWIVVTDLECIVENLSITNMLLSKDMVNTLETTMVKHVESAYFLNSGGG